MLKLNPDRSDEDQGSQEEQSWIYDPAPPSIPLLSEIIE